MWGAGAAAVAAVWWVLVAQMSRLPCGTDGTFCGTADACHRLRGRGHVYSQDHPKLSPSTRHCFKGASHPPTADRVKHVNASVKPYQVERIRVARE